MAPDFLCTVCVSMDFAQFSALIPAFGDLRHQLNPKVLLNIYVPLFGTKSNKFDRYLLAFLTLFRIFTEMSYVELREWLCAHIVG